ncbi:MAG: TlpA family protein disulfide reductase [Actinomycetota bacterium]|nr:TlpA family protein disulfide reductase [Actinomycetota bacterium]MDQ2957373.1 TlpA family protein disulfide reductase [Actinomycetota bacterium]
MTLARPAAQRRTLLAALLLTAAALTACSGGKNAVDQGANTEFRYSQANKVGTLIAPDKRKAAGPVAGTLIGGGTYALAADKGQIVVLNFFASWCPPCQTETPQFDTVYRARKSAGVRFVGLDVKDPSRSASQSWLQDKQIAFPVVYDEPARTALQIGDVPLTGLPDTVVIDKQGRVAAVYVGPVLPKDLTNALDQLAKEA